MKNEFKNKKSIFLTIVVIILTVVFSTILIYSIAKEESDYVIDIETAKKFIEQYLEIKYQEITIHNFESRLNELTQYHSKKMLNDDKWNLGELSKEEILDDIAEKNLTTSVLSLSITENTNIDNMYNTILHIAYVPESLQNAYSYEYDMDFVLIYENEQIKVNEIIVNNLIPHMLEFLSDEDHDHTSHDH